MSFDLQLEGQRALVTGGTRGAGAALVQRLAGVGMVVIATAGSLPAHPIPRVHYVAADLSTASGAAVVADQVQRRWGTLDVLVPPAWPQHEETRIERHRSSEVRDSLVEYLRRADCGCVPFAS